ncbi:unnamed protein product [Ilex paraguariensis]|uniref:Uncharacterized protein n=1 Tax=Ilex paraguariensis TaxID=185542 RepID=A0ABC8SII7_9AQUA
MNGLQTGEARNLEKHFPGCLGRMVNMFDLGAGVAGNRMLTEKPHRDGSPLSRSQSDVARMSPTGDKIEDELMVSELRRTSSNRKSNGTPMKMLIAYEMSKEVESKPSPPNLVAKLMGLDTLPCQPPNSAVQRFHSRGYSESHSSIPFSSFQQEQGLLDKEVWHENEYHQCPEPNEYKDVYEMWQHSQKTSYRRDTSPQKGRCKETTNEKKMALVRQKFIEAKRLATDEKLRQSKQFQEALEVLSSNKDLFLKFLQEPNSLFSQHLCDMQSTPPPPETKRITVLRPSKMLDHNKGRSNEKHIKKAVHASQVNRLDKSSPGFSPPAASWKIDENPSQPTRIVVLKPSPGKSHDIKAIVSPPSSSPRILHAEEFYTEPENDEARESREVAKEITRQMCENLSGHQRDDTLLSSLYSNGYNGDESSFHKSENEYAAENLSDPEVMSPASVHSWDYINRFESPYSSSFSRASYSPESSVCREAKKRLSERWAMMASNGSCLEQRHVRRSSSTLGEMLALSDAKTLVRSEEVDCHNKQESRGSTSCLTRDLHKDEGIENSPRNLLRSKSVPVSSTVYGTRLDVEVSDPEVGKTGASNEVIKARSTKLSLKGKVSSLFFSRNRKSKKEKPDASQSRDESQSAGMTPGKVGCDGSQCLNDLGLEECSSPGLHGSSSKDTLPDLDCMASKQGIISPEAGMSVTKPVVFGNSNDTQDQPSPISVLDPSFEEDYHAASESFSTVKPDRHGLELTVHPIKSNLIDKSPPIGSIARTLSWDDFSVDTASSHPSKPSVASKGGKEEHEWFFFVQTLLSVVGLDGEMAFARKPLDPSLRDKYVDLNEKEILQEAKRRHRRSTRKLVFDCVNAALVEMAGYGSDICQRAYYVAGSTVGS